MCLYIFCEKCSLLVVKKKSQSCRCSGGSDLIGPVADVPLCSFNRAFTLHQVFAFDIGTVQTTVGLHFAALSRQICLRDQYSYKLFTFKKGHLTVYHMAEIKIFSRKCLL